MANLRLGIKGVVGFVFALLITVFGWYIVPALSDILPIVSMQSIYWIGIILYWVCAVIVVPLMMIMGSEGDFKGALMGLFAFFSGYILSLVLYYTIGYLLEAMEGVYPNSTFLAIGWFAIYIIWILGMIVAPVFLTLKNVIAEKLEE